MGEHLDDLDEISEKLTNFDESLFKIEGGHLENVESFITETELGNKLTDVVEVYLMAAKLMCGNVDSVSKMLEDGMRTHPESVHFWCNKGMYHVMNKEQDAASAALKRMEELRKMEAPLLVARRDHAYWIAERGREMCHYLKAFEVFEDIMQNTDYKQHEYLKPLVDKTATLYLKVLVRFCMNRSLCKDEKPKWYEDKLHVIINLLIGIWNSSFEKKLIFVFSWLVEVYGHFEFQKFIEREIQRLSIEIGYPSITREKCLEKTEEHAVRKMNPKLLARAGKNWFFFAIDVKQQNKVSNEQKRAFPKAIELCELSLQTGAELYMAYDILYRVHMHLWAIDYYNSCKSRVYSEYNDVMGGNDRIPPWTIQKFLIKGLYFVKVTDTAGKEHLEKAHEAMQVLQDKFAKGWHRAYELARVKYLLEKSDSEVSDLFTMALDSVPSLEKNLQWEFHLNYARFLEKTSNIMAKHHYEEAQRIARTQGRKLREPEYRLIFLRKQ